MAREAAVQRRYAVALVSRQNSEYSGVLLHGGKNGLVLPAILQ